ncbi:hypothetical protein LTR05_000067 [Lithohypha guttulata]|uniref:Uncharacterized protein n=1 Tax=Lithohypha guttulata TaxID=1690604 RepID=A0AAN7T5R5_9EURO|nr:hypothetical protein LTR05_000067 [Lithohypha guttulata]
MLPLTLLLTSLSFASTVLATGYFLNPAGNDGSLSVTPGNTIDISWTNVSDYNILSLGYYSTSNQTITWLIVNSQSHPTSYRWTVDAVAKGFNLADSKLFAFYICKGLNFGDPFISSYFVINDAASSSSTSSASSTASTTVVAQTATTFTSTLSSSSTSATSLPSSVTPSNNPTSTGTAAAAAASATNNTLPPVTASDSSGLGTGAKAGISVGVVIAALAIAVIAFLLLRRKRRTKQNAGGAALVAEKSSHESTPTSAYEKAQMRGQGGTLGPRGEALSTHTGVHEMPSGQQAGGPVELGPGTAAESGRVELPATSQR